DFALRRFRAGDFRGAAALAAADEAMAEVPVILALSAIYWRNTWKYQARGYRHLFWDAGAMLSHLLAAAAALGPGTRGGTGLAGPEVNALLGLDARREGALVLVAVGGGASPAPPPPVVRPVDVSVIPLSATEVEYPLLVDAYEDSALATEA